MSLNITSPADGANVDADFTVSGTVTVGKGVPLMSGEAVSGNNTVQGTVTHVPSSSDGTWEVEFDTTAYQGQGLTWTVRIYATYVGPNTIHASITVTTP